MIQCSAQTVHAFSHCLFPRDPRFWPSPQETPCFSELLLLKEWVLFPWYTKQKRMLRTMVQTGGRDGRTERSPWCPHCTGAPEVAQLFCWKCISNYTPIVMLLLQYISGSDTNFLLNFHQLALVSSCNTWSILLSTDCISQRTHLQNWPWTVFSATLIRNITAVTKNCLLKTFIKCYSNLMLMTKISLSSFQNGSKEWMINFRALYLL